MPQTCPHCGKEIPDASRNQESVFSLGLSTRAENALRRAHVLTIRALSNMTDQDLLETEKLGAGTVDEIKAALLKREISLREETHEEWVLRQAFPWRARVLERIDALEREVGSLKHLWTHINDLRGSIYELRRKIDDVNTISREVAMKQSPPQEQPHA